MFSRATRPCVILVDELDLLASDSGLYKLFEWPNEACVIIIAIANTMDLPERFLSARIASRLGLCRVNFKPYAHPQLIAIIKLHLKDNASISQEALEYCARKIASVSGDARKAIALAQRALEECRMGRERALSSTSVTLDAMIRTINGMASTSHAMQLASMSANHKYLLLSVYLCLMGEMQMVQVEDVVERDWQLCRTHNLVSPSYGHILACLNDLCRLNAVSGVYTTNNDRALRRVSEVCLTISKDVLVEVLRGMRMERYLLCN